MVRGNGRPCPGIDGSAIGAAHAGVGLCPDDEIERDETEPEGGCNDCRIYIYIYIYILPLKNRQILGASLAYGGLPVIIDTLLGQVKLGITHSAIALNPIFIKRATSGRISSLSARSI